MFTAFLLVCLLTGACVDPVLVPGSGEDDAQAATHDAYYDSNATAYDGYDANAAYYQYDSGGYEGNNTYYDYYASAPASGAEYYGDGAAAAEYPQDYHYAYDEASVDYNGADSPTATALPETLWYQDESALDDGGALVDEISELQLDHSMGEYDGQSSPAQWDPTAVNGVAPQSDEADTGMYDAALGLVEGGAPAGIDSSNQVGGAPNALTAALDNQQQQQDSQETKSTAATSPKQKKTRQQRIQKRQELLEKQEEDKSSTVTTAKPLTSAKAGSKGALVRKSSFVTREKAKLQLKMRIARAIARKQMPLQVRILTEVCAPALLAWYLFDA